MIFVLPILLYPILGYGMIQVAAALEQKPRIVVVVGAEYLPAEVPLLNPGGDGFNPRLLRFAQDTSPLLVQPESGQGPGEPPSGASRRFVTARPRRSWSSRQICPGSFARKTRSKFRSSTTASTSPARSPISGSGSSSIAGSAESSTPDEEGQPAQSYAEPIQVKGRGRGDRQEVGQHLEPLFPFLLVMMSLTGAFYPAVDLCAGEKERGTMETLLISPASRAEIVLGKFLTVMLASVMTAVLNLVSMGLTGIFLARNRAGLAMEPTQRARRRSASPRRRSSRLSG